MSGSNPGFGTSDRHAGLSSALARR